MDSKLTKSVGHFEENKFSVGGHQFLLEWCPKLIKTYNFGQNAVNKSQFKNKNEQYCAVRLLIFKVAKTFYDLPSAIVIIFYRVSIKSRTSIQMVKQNSIKFQFFCCYTYPGSPIIPQKSDIVKCFYKLATFVHKRYS